LAEPSPITARQSDEGLRRQMEQFFEVTTDAIIFLDREYRFTFLNRRAMEIVAFRQELLGKIAWEEFPGMVFPGSPFVENYTRAMEEGVAGEFDAYYPEPINKSLRIQCYPADDGIMIFFRDVTDENAGREELQRKTDEAERQHAELATIYATAPIGLALFDLDDYHYVRLNDRQAAFFGLKPEQMVGRTLTEMAPIEGLRELFDQVKNGEPVINHPLEGTLVTDPDTYRYWTVSYFPVYGADGTVQAITAASQEITNQKKAELALIESEKLAAVGRLASSIAHEINNPLEAVTNLLYLARLSLDLEEARQFLDTAEVELRRVSAIVSQTLRFHKQASSPQEIHVEDLVKSVLSIYQGRIANTKIRVDSRFRVRRPICCFEGEIRQVLSNLVGNALDSMPNGGRLELRGRKATNWQTGQEGVIITVSDTGSGMSVETMKKVFNAFFTTKGMVGNGLGLWVSKEIIDRHHGTIHVRSSQIPSHQGTVFTLFLPFEAVMREQ
jgi:PAS domain S-box-containing protein